MSVLASATSAAGLIAAIIAAAGAILAAAIVAWTNLRAQSYERLISDIRELLNDNVDRSSKATSSAVKRGIRDVLGHPPSGQGQRWYDR